MHYERSVCIMRVRTVCVSPSRRCTFRRVSSSPLWGMVVMVVRIGCEYIHACGSLCVKGEGYKKIPYWKQGLLWRGVEKMGVCYGEHDSCPSLFAPCTVPHSLSLCRWSTYSVLSYPISSCLILPIPSHPAPGITLSWLPLSLNERNQLERINHPPPTHPSPRRKDLPPR